MRTLIDAGYHAPGWILKLPLENRFNVVHVLIHHATQEYINFFRQTQVFDSTLALPDEEAAQALFELADSYPYSWPTEEHPNWKFSYDMLQMVNWRTVLNTLRKGKDEDVRG